MNFLDAEITPYEGRSRFPSRRSGGDGPKTRKTKPRNPKRK
jgi:hypothetical protein